MEWIPIKEREPKTTRHILVTCKWKEDDYEAFELDYAVTKYYAKNGDDERHKRWCKMVIDHIIAWMPMPGPYKGV